MGQPFDLSSLFGSALEALTANRQEINALDGYNGNHGDNMVENLQMVIDALEEKGSVSPAEALQHAGQVLQSQGRGGTSQYYASGLSQAAEQLQGRTNLDSDDVISLVQSILGAIPDQGHPEQPQGSDSVLGQVLGSLTGGQESRDEGLDLGDVVDAGLTFLQAKRSGAGTTEAASRAVLSALADGQVNPLQSRTSRSAAGSLVGQSILRALTGRR